MFMPIYLQVICNYHVGETVMSLEKTVLIPGGPEALVYTTLSGTIGELLSVVFSLGLNTYVYVWRLVCNDYNE